MQFTLHANMLQSIKVKGFKDSCTHCHSHVIEDVKDCSNFTIIKKQVKAIMNDLGTF